MYQTQGSFMPTEPSNQLGAGHFYVNLRETRAGWINELKEMKIHTHSIEKTMYRAKCWRCDLKKKKLCDLMELWDDLMSMRIFLFLCFCFSSATNMYILSPKNRACLYFVARNIQVSSQVKRFPESSWLLSLMVYTF